MSAARRDEHARIRDLNATVRDQAADARDRSADALDRRAQDNELRAAESGVAREVIESIAAVRLAGASVRSLAARDRRVAAAEREAAARDRDHAAADRHHAGLDELTGVFRRGAGELALAQEIARARRSSAVMVLALIDIDGLKDVNDTHGHNAGDLLLRRVSTAITSTMRAYDVTIRWGGDEFVCSLSDVTMEVARLRIAAIQRSLDALQPGATITAGLAQLRDHDSLEELVARSGIAMYRSRAERTDR
jgi:diguanylate cyclase (GGDEF)-like protein